jgi:AcrR family transcriptional regulator
VGRASTKQPGTPAASKARKATKRGDEAAATKSAKRSKAATAEKTGTGTEPAPASRRETIVEKAAELFATKGVAATTVRDIGDAAGILSGSLYYHFPSKEAIVEEIVIPFFRQLIESYRAALDEHEDARSRLEELIRTSFRAIDEHPHACEIFQNDFKYLLSLPQLTELDSLNEEVQNIWLETLEHGVDEEVFRADVEPKIFYRFARDAIWFVVRWYHPDGRYTVDGLSDDCIAVLLDGFAVRH